MNQNNSGEIWENLWSSEGVKDDFLEWLSRDSHSVRTEKITRYIEGHSGRIENLNVLELGSGMGVYSCIFAKKGANVTLLDNNKTVLNKAKAFFEKEEIKAKFLLEDAFDSNKKLRIKFDVVMSFGFVEHFRYPERYSIIKVHYDFLKPGGILAISTPNLLFFPNEIMKLILCLRKKWLLGYEGSFSRIELATIAKRLNLKDYKIIGSSFIYDFQRYLYLYKTSSIGRRIFGGEEKPRFKGDFPEKKSVFDDFLGADIVLLGIK